MSMAAAVLTGAVRRRMGGIVKAEAAVAATRAAAAAGAAALGSGGAATPRRRLLSSSTGGQQGDGVASQSQQQSSSPPPAPPRGPPSADGGGATTTTTTTTTTHFGFKEVPYEEKEKLVKGVFNSVASKYDLMNDLMSGGMHRLWKDDFVKMAGIPTIMRANFGGEGIRLLDVAGGTGDIAFRLMQRAVESHPTGTPPAITVCDINAEMLKVGQQRARDVFPDYKIRGSLTWVEGNAECLPFPDGSFDLYTIAFGLRNVTNRAKALGEAFRVLKKGGRFLCLEFSHVALPVAREAYDAYSFEVIPRIGQAVTGDADSYRYLVESIRQFPKQTDLVAEIEAAGFRSVTYTNYTLGAVAVHSGFKWV